MVCKIRAIKQLSCEELFPHNWLMHSFETSVVVTSATEKHIPSSAWLQRCEGVPARGGVSSGPRRAAGGSAGASPTVWDSVGVRSAGANADELLDTHLLRVTLYVCYFWISWKFLIPLF